MRRHEHLRDAGRRGTAQHRADVARVLHAVEQQAEIRGALDARHRRRDDGEQADCGRQLRELRPRRFGDDQRARRRDAREQRTHRRPFDGGLGDQQRFGRAVAAAVDIDQMLAFEHAAAGFAPLAR